MASLSGSLFATWRASSTSVAAGTYDEVDGADSETGVYTYDDGGRVDEEEADATDVDVFERAGCGSNRGGKGDGEAGVGRRVVDVRVSDALGSCVRYVCARSGTWAGAGLGARAGKFGSEDDDGKGSGDGDCNGDCKVLDRECCDGGGGGGGGGG
ncbi:hypothetical protein N0V85_002772 [Neurospora sp. IMI 360204]|nr:hypothetical protein N0V85_002772 [Neurospora sp. IMI 360204]